MRPELFEIPFIHLTIKSYGLMMVVGFLAAVALIRRLSRDITTDPRHITNAALYSLIAGVVGARAFYVVHHFDQFQGQSLYSVFAIWKGGLELVGGVILAIAVIILYLWYHKLQIRQYMDILAIGLMLALAFGRIGCFLNGCCYGKPTELPWGVQFPYNSFAYISQVNADPQRNRNEPQLKLPREEYEGYVDKEGRWYPKPLEDLTNAQKADVTKGKYRCLPVHPTQLYMSTMGAILCLILYLFWRRSKNACSSAKACRIFTSPGSTFSLMFILYGIGRYLIEFLRDDNPFEFAKLTISQILSLILIAVGVVLMAVFAKMGSGKTAVQ